MIPLAIVFHEGGVGVRVAVEAGEGITVGVVVPLGCVGVDVMDMSLVETGTVVLEFCVGCALMLVGRHAINEKMHRSRQFKTGGIILPILPRRLILFILSPLMFAPDYPHTLKHRKGLCVEIIVKKARICRLAINGCLC